MNRSDITSKEDVVLLVDSFYKRAICDESIGPFFTKVSPINLDEHKPILYSFWESVLFYTGSYRGNPMETHVRIHQKSALEKHHFDTWLRLWKNTIEDLFEGEKAKEAIGKSTQIAGLMQHHIGNRNGNK